MRIPIPAAMWCTTTIDIGVSQKNARAAPIRNRMSPQKQKGRRPFFSRALRAGPTKRTTSKMKTGEDIAMPAATAA